MVVLIVRRPDCGDLRLEPNRRFVVWSDVNVLQEGLPLDHVPAASSIPRQVAKLGGRLEAEQATDARQQAEVEASVRSPEIPEPSPVARSALTAATFGGPATSAARMAGLK
ncbi:hypothetical protein JTE92_20245 [Cupriavidus oxalaticus]|uniref:Uncharacterized protein n=1 Tax=Cupriavidus oxalaticus TaxID=96344 RepID=A0A375FLV8_9BURK|nr:hypothetical protein JTE91_22015 [Cupriavidus oxalaticus]QRQ95753.1 hypothetical protein JTE92_20245 [Cupriavidus oxalaticus]SPC06687.1 hypothetical protein CO2235_U600130 [Cupriavidus oxalaticus]SPC12329.1 hypothetical protein CO2235_140130 [Cupriavidus oxalaticus]